MTVPRLVTPTRTLCRLAVQIGFLFLVFRVGQWAGARFHLPLPGNVLGMLLLFGLLSAGVVRETWIHEGAGLLTKHLAFFFVPIAVGLMQWGSLFRREGPWLLLALVTSTLAALLASGGLVRLLGRRAGVKEVPRWKMVSSPDSPLSSPSASTH